MSAIVGIDPGVKGGIAIIDRNGITAEIMPIRDSSEIDIPAITSYLIGLIKPTIYIEKVHSMPNQGVASTFTFGKGFGKLLGMCEALELPYVLVTPQKWKQSVLAGFNWKGRKAASIEYCSCRYPELDLRATKRSRKVHDGICDALCIAEYGKMID